MSKKGLVFERTKVVFERSRKLIKKILVFERTLVVFERTLMMKKKSAQLLKSPLKY